MNSSEFISQIRWRPQIGDPSFMGWLTVVAYGAAAILCFIAARRSLTEDDDGQARRRSRMWTYVAIFISFLCVNKQLDLQSLLTEVGRVLATREGWYGQRRIVQRWFVFSVAAVGVLTLMITAWRIRSVLRERILLLLGLISLLAFIVIRAASFHHVDMLLGHEVLGFRLNWILELGGIGLVGLGAVQSMRHRPNK